MVLLGLVFAIIPYLSHEHFQCSLRPLGDFGRSVEWSSNTTVDFRYNKSLGERYKCAL